MKKFLASSTVALVLVGVLPTVTFAQSEPYPLFRRDDAQMDVHEMGTLSSAQAQLSSSPKVGIRLEPDRDQAHPGQELRYWIRVTSLYDKQLQSWDVAFFFDRNKMAIIDAGGARGGGDHLRWTVPSLAPGETRSYSIRVQIRNGVKSGDVIRTYASMVWDGQIYPACSKHDLLIVGRPPVTGAGDNTRPLEDTTQFLKPMSGTKTGWFASLFSFFGN
jgi:hypothetical protein